LTQEVASVSLARRAVLQFAGLGLVFYVMLVVVSEMLVHAQGHANPFFKIATADRQDYDWLILGTSHAMPLAFGDIEATLEAATGQSVINLAAQGAGPLYHRLVLDQFLREHHAGGLIYVVDSFAFQSPAWNEDRIADPGLLARTPYRPSLVADLWAYVLREGVSPWAALDYGSGFSKVNNRERFELDAWDAEELFERRYRPSARAEDERIAYLFPQGSGKPEALAGYLEDFDLLLSRALAAGMTVKLVKMPVPASFYGKLPGEAEFDLALGAVLGKWGLSVEDDSGLLDGAEYYFDSDHLGRRGVEAYVAQRLLPLMGNALATRPAGP
jgi:hypothetical protein